MSDLSRKQQLAIERLLDPTAKTMESVALEVGVDPRTLRRWMRDETFKREYDRARRQLFDLNISALASLTGTAIAELKTILSDAKTTTREKLYAIRIVLTAAQNANVTDIEQVIDRLENALESLEVANI